MCPVEGCLMRGGGDLIIHIDREGDALDVMVGAVRVGGGKNRLMSICEYPGLALASISPLPIRVSYLL